MIHEGSFLWQWASSWAPLNGFTIAVILATLAVFATKWNPVNSIIKSIIIGGVVAAMPLGLYQLGVIIPLHTDIDLSLTRHELFTYMSFYGTVIAVGISVPYLFHQIMKATSEKYTTSMKQVGQYVQTSSFPKPATETPVRNSVSVGENSTAHASPVGRTLVFESGPDAGKTMSLSNHTYTIGRSKTNDIVVDDPTVSRTHARVTYQGDQIYVEDLNSTSGTVVDGQKVSKTLVMPGANLQVGNTKFEVTGSPNMMQTNVDPIATKENNNPNSTRVINKQESPLAWIAGTKGSAIGQSFNLVEGDNTVGRDSNNQIVINDSFISRQHAVIKVSNGQMQIFDLGSTGGSKVNDNLLSGCVLSANSTIKVGETELSLVNVENPEQFSDATMSGRTMVEHRGEQVGVVIVRSGVDAGKTFTLKSGDNTIGRNNDSHIQLNDDSVSRQHAVIRVKDGKLVLIDSGSSSGTTVDGRSVAGEKLTNGDRLTLGRSEFTVMTPKVPAMANV